MNPLTIHTHPSPLAVSRRLLHRLALTCAGALASLAFAAHASSLDSLVKAVKFDEGKNQPVLPGCFPVAADGKLIYRSYGGVHARDLRTGQLAGLNHRVSNAPSARRMS